MESFYTQTSNVVLRQTDIHVTMHSPKSDDGRDTSSYSALRTPLSAPTNREYGATGSVDYVPVTEAGSQDAAATPATLVKKANRRTVDNTSPLGVQDLENGFKKDFSMKKALLEEFQSAENRDEVSGEKLEKEDPSKGTSVVRQIIFVTMPVFMGYAALFSLQHKVKASYGIPDDNSSRSRLFSIAVSFLYLGNLIFRFAHNLIFFCVTPRYRVINAMISMMLALSVLLGPVMVGRSQNLAWVFLSYSLGGVSIGSFEANLLSSITPLGHRTKLWATIGIPFGVSSITIGAFAAMALGVTAEAIYAVTIVCLFLAIFVFSFCIPYHHVENNSDSFGAFVQNLKEYRMWLPKIKWHALALALDMCCVSVFSPGVMLYVFDNPKGVPLWHGLYVNHDAFFAVYNFFTFIGETISRKLAYTDKKDRPVLYFLIFSFLGLGINVFCGAKNFGLLCPLAAMFVFLGNGAIYNYTCKFIDSNVEKEHNLTACSFWLFVGDLGSTTGSNLIPFIKTWISARGV